MSDSDEDLMADSVVRLQHHTLMNTRGPNMNNTNITSFSFRNNMMTSTFRTNYNRQKNNMQQLEQRSMYYRRETSPMSLKSLPGSGMQNFRNYPNGMTSGNRSVFNGRSGSPMSMRSIDSNASVSAADIALAFKNVKFNRNELRIIKDAYNKFMKHRARKRIEKRRNLKLFLKGYKRKSGEDSGEQGSDSSISSDDCRSTKTFYRENISRSGPKSIISDISHFRTKIRECDMYRDCTDSLKHTKIRNMFPINNTNTNHTVSESIINQNSNNCQEKPQHNTSVVTLKDRFKNVSNSSLLPSQRFNMSATKNQQNKEQKSLNIKRNIESRHKHNTIVEECDKSDDSGSDKEEIFPEITIRENTHVQQKRLRDDNENIGSDKKRYKAASQAHKSNISTGNQSDFNFKKPQMPVRKSVNQKKDQGPERIIAMSKPPIDNIELDLPKKLPLNLEDTQNKLPVNSTEIEETANHTEISQNTTDISMRPSFIKRKLFTQKLDVVENKNLSNDNIGINSPQASLYSACREKNKVRKLVTSQSCLSRDIQGDDNVLDLIHKIVPPDQINITTACSKKEVNKTNENDKWDVTSVLSSCNIGDVSDTFTDEEIFKAPNNREKKSKKVQSPKMKENESVAVNPILPQPKHRTVTPCKVVIQKLPEPKLKQVQNAVDNSKVKSNPTKKTVSSCIKSFWDTDFESDMEDRTGTPWKPKIQLKTGVELQKKITEDNSKMNFNKKGITKGTILTIRSLQNKTMNSTMRSDISKVSKKNIDRQENKENNIVSENNKTINNNKKDCEALPKDKNLKNTKSKQKNESPKHSKVKPAKNKALDNSKNSKKESPCNTSRESLRLKEKNEKKLNNTINTDTTKRPRGRPRKSDEGEDLKNANTKKNKEAKQNKKNDKSMKQNTLSQIKLKTPQGKQNKKLFSTPVTDSSFNISNRSLRLRHR